MCGAYTRIYMSKYSTSKKLNGLRQELTGLRSEHNMVASHRRTFKPSVIKKCAPCGIRTTRKTLERKIRAKEHKIAQVDHELACC